MDDLSAFPHGIDLRSWATQRLPLIFGHSLRNVYPSFYCVKQMIEK